MKVKYSVEMEEIPRPKKQEEIIYNHICKAKDGLMNTEIVKLTGWVTLLQGIFTAWLPGFLLLEGLLT